LDDKTVHRPVASCASLSRQVDYMHRSIRRFAVIMFALPLMAWGEPANILKYRYRGAGASFEIATPPDPCIKIVDRGEFRVSVASLNKMPDKPAGYFSIWLENICSNDSLHSHGEVAFPALAMTVTGSGKTVVLRGTVPITTVSSVTQTETTEQVIFDLVLTAGSDGLRRRHGVEHVERRDIGVRSILVYDQREYVNVTASGSLSGTIAGLPVGMGNIGNFVIQTEQDRSLQVQKF